VHLNLECEPLAYVGLLLGVYLPGKIQRDEEVLYVAAHLQRADGLTGFEVEVLGKVILAEYKRDIRVDDVPLVLFHYLVNGLHHREILHELEGLLRDVEVDELE